jgi:hypothetical protein
MLTATQQPHVITYTRGWTPYGIPCTVKLVDGQFEEATYDNKPCQCARFDKPSEQPENPSQDTSHP